MIDKAKVDEVVAFLFADVQNATSNLREADRFEVIRQLHAKLRDMMHSSGASDNQNVDNGFEQ